MPRMRFLIARRRGDSARGRFGIDREALKQLAITVAPAVLLVVLAFWVAFKFVKPAPPASFVMTTGVEGGAYHLFAQRYQEILARDGIRVELRLSAGSLENLKRLADPDSGVEVGFVQGGVVPPESTQRLVSLGAMYYEPLWIFYRGDRRLERINQLTGKRVAAGLEGSGTRVLALHLLTASGAHTTAIVDIGGKDAMEALRQGKVDAAFFVASPDAPMVQGLLRMKQRRVMSIVNAEAYARRFPFLTPLVLPRGVVDLAADIPPADVTLLATTANLVARDDFHPALAQLLLQAATEVHAGPAMLQRQGEFPAAREVGFPLSEEAQRYYRSGTPFLQRFLPFWVANFIQRMLVLLVPLFAVLVPAVRFLPGIYQWRMKSRIFRWYGALKSLEANIGDRGDPALANEYLRRLDEIEHGVTRTRVPTGFADSLYDLRGHIEMVRGRIEQLAREPHRETLPEASSAPV
jgi:TRAP-type uncharacterized transport system substrate-binding protein